MASRKQVAANRANARRSTGPRTEKGKARSALNATRHGLTGQVVVTTSEDLAAYQTHCEAFAAHYSPQTPMERATIQQLADIRWRLHRIAAVEANLFSLTGYESPFRTGNEQVDRALGQAQALPARIASLATLSLYEQRLLRAFDRMLEEFRELQWRRTYKNEPARRVPDDDRPSDDGSGPAASVSVTEAKDNGLPEIGFVSSTSSGKAKSAPAHSARDKPEPVHSEDAAAAHPCAPSRPMRR